MPRKQKVFFTTTFMLCENNGYMSTRLNNFFAQNSCELVATAEQADWIIISTCGFDQGREDIATSIVTDHIKRFSGEKQIVVCGCLPKICPEVFQNANVITIGVKELHKFNNLFHASIPIETISGGRLDYRFLSKDYAVPGAYYLQICQGCVNSCSYCAIKKAKGYVTSTPPDALIREVEQAIESGFDRIMLLSDDCGSYGVDLGIGFADLLRRINQYNVCISINYFEPSEFQQLYRECGASIFERVEFINIPIQSTSSRITKLMNRKYDPAEVMRTVREMKKNSPRTYCETHIIYGFPTETREEFEGTFRASEYFDSVIFIRYTDRKGVKASLLSPKVTESEINYRTNEIVKHPRFAPRAEGATPPLVLLGYDEKTISDILVSLEQSHPKNQPEFVIL